MSKGLIYIGVIILAIAIITPAFSTSGKNIYYIIGAINDKQAENLYKFLEQTKDLNPKTNRILLVISGNGGNIKYMEKMRESIRSSSIPIDTIARGWVASASADLFLEGQNRYDINAVLAFHLLWGIHPIQSELDFFNKALKDTIKNDTGFSDALINHLFKPGHAITEIDAQEAINLGISTSNKLPDFTIYNRN